MCEPVTMSTLAVYAAAGGAALGGVAMYQQGQAAKQVGRNNQIMAEYAAQDETRRGEEQAMTVRQQAAALKGTQRSTMAAKGLDLTVGTQAEILDQTDFFGQTDINTTRNNAARGAWSARAGGANAAAQGNASARQGTIGAFGSLLTAGGQVASKWQPKQPAPYTGVW